MCCIRNLFKCVSVSWEVSSRNLVGKDLGDGRVRKELYHGLRRSCHRLYPLYYGGL